MAFNVRNSPFINQKLKLSLDHLVPTSPKGISTASCRNFELLRVSTVQHRMLGSQAIKLGCITSTPPAYLNLVVFQWSKVTSNLRSKSPASFYEATAF
jgi:hypothetical protein